MHLIENLRKTSVIAEKNTGIFLDLYNILKKIA